MSLLVSYKALILLCWFALIFAGERVFRAADYPPQFTRGQLWQRLGSNLSLSAINMVLSPLLIIPLTVIISSQFPSWRPEALQGGWMIIVDLLLLDCFLYWWHRASHRIPFLWRFHEVHHLDEFLDSTTALRFHFGEVFISALVRVVVISLLAIPIETVILFEIVLMVATIFNHSNINLPAKLERLIRYVFVTPWLHWVHHHNVREDTDSNYATIFSLWDPLFGSRNSKLRWLGMPLGVEQRHELPFYKLVLRPLREP